ncbi:MAG: hypothetical protein ACRDQA_02875 [Nocardioidaceae bacterium]
MSDPNKNHTFRNVFLALCAFSLVAVVGIVVLLGLGANEVSKQMDAEQAKSSISKKQFRSLDMGTQKKVIMNRFGEPTDKQKMEQAGLNKNETFKSSCIYYNRKGGEFLEAYQLCFNNGDLSSKNKW